MRSSETLNELVAALAKAQGEFPVPKKDQTGEVKGTTKDGRPYSYTYQYADLPGVIEAVRVVLSKHEIAYVQTMAPHPQGVVLTTVLLHSSGQWLASDYPMPRHQKPQHMGSEITYGRRYALTAMLGIAADDDDGAAAQDAPPPQQPDAPQQQPEPVEVPPLTKDDMLFVADQLWENERNMIDAWGAENEVHPPQLQEELLAYIETNFSQERMTRRDLYKQVRAELSR